MCTCTVAADLLYLPDSARRFRRDGLLSKSCGEARIPPTRLGLLSSYRTCVAAPAFRTCFSVCLSGRITFATVNLDG